MNYILSLSPFKGSTATAHSTASAGSKDGTSYGITSSSSSSSASWDSTTHRISNVSSKTRLRIKAAQSWSKVRTEVSHAGRHALEEEVRGSGDDADPHRVMKLGHICLEDAFDRKPRDRLKLLRAGVLLMEWAHLHELEYTTKELRLLARGHYEYWLCGGILSEDSYNLMRAKELYEKAIQHIENTSKPDVLIEYCRVLQHSGDEERAAQISMEVIKAFEMNTEYANYIFYAGCLHKSLGVHDIAATYLFESIQQGPPRYFSKLEMMFLISRNIEENAKRRGDQCEDAYRIVFDHEKIDGHIPDSVQYEKWVANSDTWRRLGDKCTLHGMYSLARDLYGQGLLRDDSSFLKPKLWFNFAKSCYRSGRTSDAALAIQQALTMAPYNQQLLKTLSSWSQAKNNNSFEHFLDQGIHAIVAVLPPLLEDKTKAAITIQSNYRSHQQRRHVLLGIGKRQMTTKTFSAIGVLIHGHPVVLAIRTDLMGSVKGIGVHDVTTNMNRMLKLSRPFMPVLQIGQPRIMKVSMVLKKTAEYDTSTAVSTEHTINIRFTDPQSCEYLERDVVLRSTNTTNTTNTTDTTEATSDDSSDALKHSDRIVRLPTKDGTLLTLQLMNDDSPVQTNMLNIEVARGGCHHSSHFYLYRCYQTIAATTIAITQVSSDKRALFTIARREHIDRSTKLSCITKVLNCIIEQHPIVASYLLNSDLDGADKDSISSRFDVMYNTSSRTSPTTSIRLITSVTSAGTGSNDGPMCVNITTDDEKRTIIGSSLSTLL